MAPILLDTPCWNAPSPKALISSRNVAVCSDPSVAPSKHASESIHELWWLHGHPHSRRYANPNLVSLGALIRHDGVVYKGQKAFLYPTSTEAAATYGTMTWDEFDQVTETIALSYAHELELELEEANVTQRQPTIALVGGGTTLPYFCTQLALQKLGVRVLLLAESNSKAAIHHLLSSCNALAVITDSNNTSIDTNGIKKVPMVEILSTDTTKAHKDVNNLKFQDRGDIWERHSFIIHSSGSTGLPKPIIHTNRSIMLIARMYRLFQSFTVDNWFLLFPMYHIAGLSVALSNLPNGQILSFPPLNWPPSSTSLLSSWETLSSMGYPIDCVHCAPTLIENLYDHLTANNLSFAPLTSLKILQPGGAALSDRIVKDLVAKGVNVKSTYGSTEIGPPFRTIPHERSNPNCYTFRNLYPDSPFIKMEPQGEGLFECVVYNGFELAAELWDGKNLKADEPFRTNDLFKEEPSGSRNFILRGRKDDILILNNGENTSAGAMQVDIQTSSKVIQRALVLGNGRPCVCLLIEVHEDFDLENDETDQMVWNAVQTVNARSPTHSRVVKEMMYIVPRGETLPITPKGNVKRKEAEKTYASQIETLYTKFCSSSTPHLQEQQQQQQPLSDFLRTALSQLTNIPATEIKDSTTFHQLGINSLLALSLRSSLSTFLGQQISISTILEYPTISALACALSSPSLLLAASSDQNPFCQATKKESAKATTLRILNTLSANIQTWPIRTTPDALRKRRDEKEIILLTGTTGSLGSHILQTLISKPSVSRIYLLIRGPSPANRLFSSFRDRLLDTSLLSSPKLRVLSQTQVPSTDSNQNAFGLSEDEHGQLVKEVTTIVHIGWKVDFLLPVQEFEDDCLRGMMDLLRLCNEGREKKMVFASSVATCLGPSQPSPVAESLDTGKALDPEEAMSTGYAQSKWIAERLLQQATQHLSIPTTVLRIGQLSGSTATGKWNTDELWPILFATSLHENVRAVPNLKGKMVDWVPIDICASTISDLFLHDSKIDEQAEGACQVFNIVNPRQVSWKEVVQMLQTVSKQQLEVVSLKAWAEKLNGLLEKGASAKSVPGLRLLAVFESMVQDEEGGNSQVEGKQLVTAKTASQSQNFRELEAYNKNWMGKSMAAWREKNFLS